MVVAVHLQIQDHEIRLSTYEKVLNLKRVDRQRDPPVAIRVQHLLHEAQTGEVVPDHHDVRFRQESVQDHLGRSS